MIGIPSNTADFGGSSKSPMHSIVYKDFGGKYTVYYDWELSK
jgi:hypothetical protein